jgi:hypothetical protein
MSERPEKKKTTKMTKNEKSTLDDGLVGEGRDDVALEALLHLVEEPDEVVISPVRCELALVVLNQVGL